MSARAAESEIGQVMPPALPAEPPRAPVTRPSVPPAGRRTRARHWYTRPTTWLAGLLVVVVVVAAAITALQNGQSIAPSSQAPVGGLTAAPTAAQVPLSAHGVVEPVLRARVGTQGGGVIQTLAVAAGLQVAARQELAVIQGPSGAEILTAPFAGTVTDVLVHLGDTVIPGTVIATVGDLSAYQIETTDVDQFLVAHVHPGQTVRAVIDAISTRSLSGTVHTVAAEPQAPSSGTGTKIYAVTVSLPGPPADLRPGMTARLTFTP